MTENNVNAFLLFTCPDQNGIVTKITQFIYESGGNIINLDEHVNQNQQFFSLRIAWNMSNSTIPASELRLAFEPLAKEFGAHWKIEFSDKKQRVAIFVSKYDHCLQEILWRYNMNEYHIEIPLIISNHPDLKPIADAHGIPYYVFPITKDTKKEQEAKEIALLKEQNIDLVVLARYMQVLSPNFIEEFENKIINIHHSFLPGFVGGNPYKQAYERGVKMIGATSHFVTTNLDEGPIIEQDIMRITHKDTIKDLIRKGRDLERIVLARALSYKSEHRIIVDGTRTIVFD
ncbi:formyltetrahydrofolate deformylase [Ancylomarina sp. 16SWW S1-10-2]|uniref:formyltetrahydrofolate deformylase n=1 Tax=Ancylomarina sp. 16SWW S1-10-2 TaxID=2499681 RepID=UPI0012AE299F|nr:formyltetrahydrofolate deformylase [Ancylomarina sp. 16SWW S1-10-2]MRT92212.1 formyltetrahydrofolate deformylase [Ancylomarina sp. 16SWW S1-10-2]